MDKAAKNNRIGSFVKTLSTKLVWQYFERYLGGTFQVMYKSSSRSDKACELTTVLLMGKC